MSQNVKFEQRETVRTEVNGGGSQGGNGGGNGRGGPPPQVSQQRSGEKDDLIHKVGDAITKGGSTDGYLAVRASHQTDCMDLES